VKSISCTDRIVGILIVIYVAGFTGATYLMYHSFYYYDFDLAIFNQIMWNTLHDGFFNSTIITGGNYLSQQMTPILLLFLPFYFLFQSPLCLLFLQSLFLGLGTLPLYLIVRDHLSEKWGLVFSILYLLHPTIAYMNLFEFHTNSFEPFLFFFSFYFLQKKKFTLFLVGIFLCLLCKEDVAFPVFMIGIYAFLARHEKKYFITPILMSISYLTLVFLFIMPALGSNQYLYIASESYGRYAHLGKSVGEILRNAITHPLVFIHYALSQENIKYLAQMITFSGFLPLFSPEVLIIILPSLMENLLSTASSQVNFTYQYSSAITPFLLLASALSIEKLSKWISPFPNYKAILNVFLFMTLAISLLSSAVFNPLFTFHTRGDMFILNEKDEARKQLLSRIPPDASVMATFNFLPALSNRKRLYSYHNWYDGNSLNLSGISLEESGVEYILIDSDDYYMNNSFRSIEGDMRQKGLLRDLSWGIVALSQKMVLLKRNYRSPYSFVDVYKMLMDDEVGKANFEAALWLKENTEENDLLYATTVSSYVQYASEISERHFLNYTDDSLLSKELSTIELPENFGKNFFVETLKKYSVSYLYIFHKLGKSEVIIWGTDKNTIFSKPDIIASHPDFFELVYENKYVRIYKIKYPKAFNLFYLL
jgi:uncharacterized membrane protein